jgi:opacity protein-like surface antigen
MKKILIVLLALILVFFFLAGVGEAKGLMKGLSFKLSGGYSTAKVGDINTYAQDLDSAFRTTADDLDLTKEGNLKNLVAGFHFEGEIVINLFGNLGIGFGAGHVQWNSESETVLIQDETQVYKGFFKPSITAIPLQLSAYYFYPVTSSMRLYFKAGVGYYYGKSSVTFQMDEDDPLTGLYWERTESKITGKDFGYHGGFGYEFDIGSNLVFFIESKARLCKLKNWKGDLTYTDSDGVTTPSSGTMWYCEELDPVTDISHVRIVVQEVRPDDPAFTVVREFEADLSGISFFAGLKIRF